MYLKKLNLARPGKYVPKHEFTNKNVAIFLCSTFAELRDCQQPEINYYFLWFKFFRFWLQLGNLGSIRSFPCSGN